ncbi:hypothetical protein [Bartonella sp. DGB1]|uniref:hypothetical protein n=1 Tax=Bartonella sp. DGB1 TaxID=3239807 RepID=UPI0035235823
MNIGAQIQDDSKSIQNVNIGYYIVNGLKATPDNPETAKSSVALGANIYAQHPGTEMIVVIGESSTVAKNQSKVVSFGGKGSERRLTNIAAGINDSDLITYRQLLDRLDATKPIVLNKKGYFDANGQAISNLADAKTDTDAINVKQLKNTINSMSREDRRHVSIGSKASSFRKDNVYLGRDITNDYGAVSTIIGNKIINDDFRIGNTSIGHNIISGIKEHKKTEVYRKDGVYLGANINAGAEDTRRSIVIGSNSILEKNQSNVASFGKKQSERKLTNAAPGTANDNAAIISQIKEYALYHNGKNYDAKGKKISNAPADSAINSAVNMKQLNEFAIYFDESSYRALNKSIAKVKDGSSENHAINVGQINKKEEKFISSIKTDIKDNIEHDKIRDTALKIMNETTNPIANKIITNTIEEALPGLLAKVIDEKTAAGTPHDINKTLLSVKVYDAKNTKISNLADANINSDADAVNVRTAKLLINTNVKSRLGTIGAHHDKSITIGDNASTSGADSIAIGSIAKTKKENSLSFGNNASAANGGIAIGNNSSADSNEVSFGNSNLQRKLVNIANAKSDTDVINVGQLKDNIIYSDGVKKI